MFLLAARMSLCMTSKQSVRQQTAGGLRLGKGLFESIRYDPEALELLYRFIR
jgi:hypothetical protein